MAEILPLRAWRYNHTLDQNIENLTSPLFDVVTTKQREALYRNPVNSIHLSVPLGEYPAETAARLLETWKEEGVIAQDPLPGIYVYYQYFRLSGSDKEYCRKGFICNIKAYDWKEGVLLRHENTIPSAVNDRIELLEQTQLNASPTHGLYTDTAFRLEPYMDESIKTPIYETEDYQGVRDVLAVIHDHEVIKLFLDTLQDKQVLLADGHHRYEGSLAYRKKMRARNPEHTGYEPYNYHLMYLTNTEHDDLRILPTHRLLADIPMTDEEFLDRLREYFVVTPKEDPYELNEVIVGKQWAFGLYLDGNAYKLRLKPEVHQQIDWNFPKEVKELDLTVMHYFIFEKILGIYRQAQRSHPGLTYERNFTACISKVDAGKARLALITNDVSMEQVKKVCYSGAIMPQKSTFFYPKVICGFLFSSIKEDEFITAAAACL
ncbi:uncharacterized protein (DUF1015 family) [Pontibacter ummariensis]|uniref:Uncharacterized conserved protein, DUF1015 family n=1 Tax=Pontibacter ummariensis TaxID=1610492 RepID=A0A239BSW2_9BACT|nr:DUF1015 domain-containing protein [Pontibacter ummariensis]PRY15661.1 uncharacterized protein (DUF1015 family) [Pontibacter ummariensis]SNS10498.1 Uncharacterized conserved protein, DUF1015 family [Pontibacter ummariensis]